MIVEKQMVESETEPRRGDIFQNETQQQEYI